MRVRAPPAPVAPMATPARAVPAARVVRLAIIPAAAALATTTAAAADAVAVQPGEHGGEEEEDGVHDAEGEARLEQRARLVGVDAQAVAVDAKEAKVDVVRGAVANVGAIGAGDEAEVVDAGDEGTYEACEVGGGGLAAFHLFFFFRHCDNRAEGRGEGRHRAHTQIDKCDKSRVGAAPVVGEECKDGPGEGQD